MKFEPAIELRNWRTGRRSAMTSGGRRVCISQSVKDAEIILGSRWGEVILTPTEALSLAAELMNAAVAMQGKEKV